MRKIKNNWKVALIVAVGIIAIILLGVFCIQSSQNRAFTLEEQVNTADSDIKVQEKRRVDLVYNLANCVKQYDKHEAETLTAIVENRGSTGDIENVTTAITAVSEAYPELKSNENYKELINELSITENLIAEYRSNYNKQVKEYNRYIRKFPTRFFLNILGYDDRIGLLEEMADAYICLNFLESIFDIKPDDLQKAIDVKLERERRNCQ